MPAGFDLRRRQAVDVERQRKFTAVVQVMLQDVIAEIRRLDLRPSQAG